LFYQYWRNIEDVKVEECLGLLTFLPMDEVRRLGALKDADINYAKEVLAYETTKIVHGEEEAKKAQEAARALFGGSMKSEDIPTTSYPAFNSFALAVIASVEEGFTACAFLDNTNDIVSSLLSVPIEIANSFIFIIIAN
jgi:tyrosyl-tRNA synthetase